MTLPLLIAIGGYADVDAVPMQAACDVRFLMSPDEIATLPDSDRAAARAIAYKAHAPLNGAAMDLLPELGIISNYGVGYDAIDVDAAQARGIRVTNTPGVLNDDVADIAATMLIAQCRQMVPASDWVRTGTWASEGAMPLARKASGGKVGIVGLGRIGREIADRLAAFKMEIHYHSRSAKDVPAGWTYHADALALAEAVDFLVVALVGGPETQGYVSAEMIAALGADGIIVNISRGSTIDEEAMILALQTGALRGAALDVFMGEPDIDPRFLALDNALLLPHIGSATTETRAAMGALQRQNIAAFLAGDPLLTPVV